MNIMEALFYKKKKMYSDETVPSTNPHKLCCDVYVRHVQSSK